MPNWCSNKLSVSGKPAAVDAFIAAVRDNDSGPLSFSSLLPTPDFETDVDPSQVYSLGQALGSGAIPGGSKPPRSPNEMAYNWQVKTWGTKWDVDGSGEVSFEREGDRAEYFFQTAWNPPLNWVENVSSMFAGIRLEIIFVEEGMDFAGRVVFENGNVAEDEELDIRAAYEALGYDSDYLDEIE